MARPLLLLFLIFPAVLKAQNFKGQWKGSFVDKSTSFSGWGGEKCDYVLELETSGNQITGYSYTYFTEGGKRFYTICKLQGSIIPKQKYVEVREVERTKTNVPVNVRNCFQVHKLTYYKSNDSETLRGEWIPLPNQAGDCGYGVTELKRRVLNSQYPGFNKGVAKTAPLQKKPSLAVREKRAIPSPPVAQAKKPKKPEIIPDKQIAANTHSDPEVIKSDVIVQDKVIAPPAEFQKRNLNILKTITVKNDVIKVDLYDNGEIDGDSISLVYNGKVILNNKKLSEKAISFKLNVDSESDINELVMFAENLGTIPPNTALMVVTDGASRYEVRITSDLQKSGVIRFVHRN